MSKNLAVGFSDLHTQMKITNKLLAAQLKEKIQQKDLVRLLMTTGASDQEIADVLGTTAATVSMTKQRLKKEVEAKKSAKVPASIEGELVGG